jgi:hypothetical protein
MTREEHLNWAKTRAFEYLDRNEPDNALASILSDLGKHPELGEMPIDGPAAVDAYVMGNLREWIERLV